MGIVVYKYMLSVEMMAWDIHLETYSSQYPIDQEILLVIQQLETEIRAGDMCVRILFEKKCMVAAMLVRRVLHPPPLPPLQQSPKRSMGLAVSTKGVQLCDRCPRQLCSNIFTKKPNTSGRCLHYMHRVAQHQRNMNRVSCSS